MKVSTDGGKTYVNADEQEIDRPADVFVKTKR